MSLAKKMVANICFCSLLVFCDLSEAAWFSRDGAVMGTTVHIEIWVEDEVVAHQLIDMAFTELHRIDSLLSPYKPQSELSRLNKKAASGEIQVSPELFELLKRSHEFSVETAGAFDITFASVGHAYNYREQQKPTEAQIWPLLSAVNFRHIHLNHNGAGVTFSHPDTRVDLGGIAKGYAVERVARLLAQRGVRSAQVTAGGDTRFIGNRQGAPWSVGIRDPRNKQAVVAVLPLVDEAMSTSGDYERYFIKEGERYHHIIDPGSGHSVKGIRSVTIIGPEATATDALSTSVFVLGVEKGLALINKRQGFEVVIVDSKGKLFFSNGLAKQDK